MAETDKTNEDNEPMNETQMSLGDHLMELRSRMIKSIIGLLVGFVVCLFLGDQILGFITAPAIAALKANGCDPRMHVLAPPEAFMSFIKISLISGIFVASPWIFNQVWGFVAAGLYPKEKRFVNVFVPFSATLFVLGGLFFITIVAPISLNFFIQFSRMWQPSSLSDSSFYNILLGVDDKDNKSDDPGSDLKGTQEWIPPIYDTETVKNYPQLKDTLSVDISTAPGGKAIDSIRNMQFHGVLSEAEDEDEGEEGPVSLISNDFRLKDYISFVLVLSLAFGLAFQMPLVVFLLGKIGLVTLATFQSIRKYVLLGIVVFSALITPPDVISQVCMSFPMYILYETGILLLRFWNKKKA